MAQISEPEILPVIKEELVIEKRPVLDGRVRVTTQTEHVDEVARVRLDADQVEIERVPIGRDITEMPDVRYEGNVTIVPVVEEVLVVEKRLILKEEVRITRRTTSETVEVPVTLRKQRVHIERSDGTSTSPIEEEPGK